MGRVLQHREPIGWARPQVRPDVYALARTQGGASAVDGYSAGDAVDPLSLMAWLDKATLIRALEAEVDRIGDDSVALSETDRIDRERAALERLLQLEHTEAGIAEAADALVRPDIDPRAYLQIEGPAPNRV